MGNRCLELVEAKKICFGLGLCILPRVATRGKWGVWLLWSLRERFTDLCLWNWL